MRVQNIAMTALVGLTLSGCVASGYEEYGYEGYTDNGYSSGYQEPYGYYGAPAYRYAQPQYYRDRDDHRDRRERQRERERERERAKERAEERERDHDRRVRESRNEERRDPPAVVRERPRPNPAAQEWRPNRLGENFPKDR